MSFGLYGNGMHDFVMFELEVGLRVAQAQDSEDCGWSALDNVSYAEFVATQAALIELRDDVAARISDGF